MVFCQKSFRTTHLKDEVLDVSKIQQYRFARNFGYINWVGSRRRVVEIEIADVPVYKQFLYPRQAGSAMGS